MTSETFLVINADQWTVEGGAGRFTEKSIAAEKARAGLRHAVVCPNVTRRTKEGIAQSKRARAGPLAMVRFMLVRVLFPAVLSTCYNHFIPIVGVGN